MPFYSVEQGGRKRERVRRDSLGIIHNGGSRAAPALSLSLSRTRRSTMSTKEEEGLFKAISYEERLRSRQRRSRPRLRSTLRRSTSPTKTRTCSSWCFLASEWRPVCPRCCWLAPIPNIPTRCVYRMCSLYSRKCRCVCIGYAFVCVRVFIYVFMLCMHILTVPQTLAWRCARECLYAMCPPKTGGVSINNTLSLYYKTSRLYFYPSTLSPSQEGSRDQRSFTRRGMPSKGEVRALHHHPVPALTFTMSYLLPSRRSHRLRRFSTLSTPQRERERERERESERGRETKREREKERKREREREQEREQETETYDPV